MAEQFTSGTKHYQSTENMKWIHEIFDQSVHFLKYFYKIVSDNFIIASWIFIIGLVSILITSYERMYINDAVILTETLPSIMHWHLPDAYDFGLDCRNGAKCHILGRRKIPLGQIEAFIFSGQIDFSDLPLPRRPQEVIWALLHEESPKNVAELSHEKVLNLFNFSATFSRHSDVPYPNHLVPSLEDITSTKYFVNTSVKNSLLDELAPILYLQSSCGTSSDRDMYVEKLMQFIHIDSYGACLRNKFNDTPLFQKKKYLDMLGSDKFHEFIANYKFIIAIENGVCDDYSTEKLWRPIKTGTVPIYFGDPLIRDWLPNKNSAILLEDFPTPEIMSKYIKKLNENDELYEQYLEHKIKKLITNKKLIDSKKNSEYQDNYEEINYKLECLICRRIYAKKRNESNEVNIVNKHHYHCPEPVSALTFKVNPTNHFTWRWSLAKHNAEMIYKVVMENYSYTDQILARDCATI